MNLDAERARLLGLADIWPTDCGCSEDGPCWPCDLRVALTNLIVAQAAEIERLRADAERYRWLRGPQKVAGVGRWENDVWHWWGEHERLDTALDAAIERAVK